MRPNTFLLLLILCFFSLNLRAKTVSLSFTDAIKLRKIKLSKSDVDGLAYDNIRLELLSLSNDSLQIYFEPGLMFEPRNTEFQTLLLADSSGVVLFPREFTTATLQGYCTESSDLGPRNLASYQTIRWAEEDLKQLAWLIYRAVAYGQQGLIWDYQNKVSRINISLKSGTEGVKEAFISFFDSYRPGTILTFDVQPEEKKPEPRHVVSIAANFPFMTDVNRTLTLNVLAEDGQIIRQFFQNKSYYAGAHVIRFGFSDFYPPGTSFRAQLVDNQGVVFKELTVDETTLFTEMEVHQIRYRYSFFVKKNLQNMTLAAYHENGERLATLKTFPTLPVAHHQLQLVFTHYFDPGTKFILELSDETGKVYDKTGFDALGNTRKLYQEWKP